MAIQYESWEGRITRNTNEIPIQIKEMGTHMTLGQNNPGMKMTIGSKDEYATGIRIKQ